MSEETTSIKVKNYVNVAQFEEDLKFSDVDLSSAMMQQASLFAHYAIQSAHSNSQVERLKLARGIIRSEVDREIREKAIASGSKVTEASISSEIERHKKYVGICKAIIEAQQVADLAKSAMEAFRQRRDMLTSMGLMTREEMKGKLAIMHGEARDQEMSDRRERVLAGISKGDGPH